MPHMNGYITPEGEEALASAGLLSTKFKEWFADRVGLAVSRHTGENMSRNQVAFHELTRSKTCPVPLELNVNAWWSDRREQKAALIEQDLQEDIRSLHPKLRNAGVHFIIAKPPVRGHAPAQ